MKQRIFGWITVLLGIVMALAVVEITAIAWLYLEDGHYTPAAELYDRTQNTYVHDLTRRSDCRYIDTLFPHPYLAFVHHDNPPCGLEYVNKIGLFGDDYPVVKRTDRYVILLTGGSVASQMAQNWTSPPAIKYLEVELNNHYLSPNGKPFEVLNGGDGAWKEPQAFILFSLYATSVDAVVTLDGFNEYYSFWPGTEERLESPNSNFLEVNPFVADENFGDAAIGWVIGRIAGVLSKNRILSHSHAAYMIIRGIEAVAKSKDVFKSNKKTTLRGLFEMPEEIRKDHDLAFAVQLSLYQKYERGIEAIARDNGIRTAYFLQPVPAYGKVLTEEEKKVAGDLSYGELYRRVVAGMMTLKDKGLPIFDLGDVVSGHSETLYADHIHFYRKFPGGESDGYRIMATRMAEKLAETWGLQRKP